MDWGLGTGGCIYCTQEVLSSLCFARPGSKTTGRCLQLAVLYLSAFMASALTLDEYVDAATRKVQGAAPLAADAWRYVHPPLECACVWAALRTVYMAHAGVDGRRGGG